MIQTLTDAPEGKFWPVCQTCVHLCPALGILKSNLDSENLGLIPKIILNSIIFQKLFEMIANCSPSYAAHCIIVTCVYFLNIFITLLIV